MNQHTQSTGGELEAIVKHHAPFFMKYESEDMAVTQLGFILRQDRTDHEGEIVKVLEDLKEDFVAIMGEIKRGEVSVRNRILSEAITAVKEVYKRK